MWPENLIEDLNMSYVCREGLFAALALLKYDNRRIILKYYRDGIPLGELDKTTLRRKNPQLACVVLHKGISMLYDKYFKYLSAPPVKINTSEERDLRNIGLNTKTASTVKYQGNRYPVCRTIDDFRRYSWDDIKYIHGLGEKGYWELFNKLREYGVKVKEDLYVR